MPDSHAFCFVFSIKFGLYEVDFRSPDRTRTPRASAFYYSSVIKSNSLNVPEDIGTVHASTSKATTKTSSYLLMSAGLLLAVAIISVVVYTVRKRRMLALRKDSYIGVQTEDSAS
ncbi:Glycoside hydrolase [Operophtera brumata]|uniref:Glycoside hydrolase n=1 Tax=Operophtera brumata TaxID=104452 RepID=A0A0L7KI25_OPEBR|nr:Glycoside hydrolase [Operophtera brumata]